MPSFTFKREERLKSHTTIRELFTSGTSFGAFPLRLVYLPLEKKDRPYPIQFALTVPKKKFPKAVDRNLIRRKIREAYRLHKHLLYQALEESNYDYALMVIYVNKQKTDYSNIESAMIKIIKRFIRELN